MDERSPRCLGCLNFTGFAPLTQPEDWDPDQDAEHVLTCRAFPWGIPEDVLSHRLAHHRPLAGQEGAFLYDPREPASLGVAEAAEALGCSARSVRRYLGSGLMWGVRRAGRWQVSPEEVRLFWRPGTKRRGIPPGFFRPQ
jgi:hypothetical protein